MKVAYLLACDSLAPDPNSGKINFLNVFDKITLLAPESKRSLSVGGRILDVTPGTQRLKFSLEKEGGGEAGSIEVPLELSGVQNANFGVSFSVTLRDPARYYLRVTQGGNSLVSAADDFFIDVVR